MTTIERIGREQTEDLRLLWLELTTTCNLECIHCYAESGPLVRDENPLAASDYMRIMDDASDAGCTAVQFIGGEPTLFRDLPLLLHHARFRGFTDIEIYTNATHITEHLLDAIVESAACVATSFYCDDPAIHDAITTRRGSHAMTVDTIMRLLEKGVELRVGVIAMAENQNRLVETEKFLRALGVTNINTGAARRIGRGNGDAVLLSNPMGELCGGCSEGVICVSPVGVVTPCVMSRAWPVGSIRQASLREILDGVELTDVRSRIAAATQQTVGRIPMPGPGVPKPGPGTPVPCNPDRTHCQPDITCPPRDPCDPKCEPGRSRKNSSHRL